jgi:hypothetical protein
LSQKVAFLGVLSNIRKIISFLCNVFQSLASKSQRPYKNLMKRSRIYTAALLLTVSLSSLSLFAQSSKNVSVSNFNELSVSSGIDLYLTQGSSESLKFVGDKDLLENVTVEKDGTGIKIKYKDGFHWSGLFSKQSVKVYVTYKTLYAVSASGGSDVFTQNPLKTNHLTLNASGGSDLKMDVACKDIEIHSSGGSDVDLKGNAGNMALHTSGGSDVNALNFRVDYAKVDASGGSDANIFVTKALEANASGGSDVHYKGDASYKKTSSSRSGSVTKID